MVGQLSSVQSLSHVQLLMTPWTAVHQASLSITNSWSLLKLMSIRSMMPSNHLIFCCPLLLLPSIFPSIRVFISESVLFIRWPKYWSFSFKISPSNEYSRLISFRTDGFDLLSVWGILSAVFLNATVQKLQCISLHAWSVVSNSATPWTITHQAPLSMGFFREEYCSELPFPSLGNLPDPGIEPMSLACIGRHILYQLNKQGNFLAYIFGAVQIVDRILSSSH